VDVDAGLAALEDRMKPSDWDKAQALFHRALEMAAEERDAFLVGAANGDEALLATVREMLAAHAHASGFIEPPEERSDPAADPEARSAPLLGTRFGDFLLKSEVGRGGMGVVYRARQLSLERDVAVKVLPPAMSASRSGAERFQREAFAASKLDHPGIASVIAYGQEEGFLFYAMRLVEGPSLRDVLDAAIAGRTSPVGDALVPGDARSCASFVSRFLGVLAYVHGRGVLHRDVAPGNLLVSEGEPVLIDFGLAKDLDLASITRTGESGGTPNYMSPEQVRAARESIDERTDLYSTGAVLYELLTLRPPFEGANAVEVLHKITTVEPRPLHALDKRIPRALERVCLKALQKDSSDRYASAEEMRADLERFLAGESVDARGPSLGKRTRRALVSRRSLLQATPFLLIAGAAGGYLTHRGRVRAAGRARLSLSWAADGPVRVTVQRHGDVPGALGPPEYDAVERDGVRLALDPGNVRITLAIGDAIVTELSRRLEPGEVEEELDLTPPSRWTESGMVRVEGAAVGVPHYALEGDGGLGRTTSEVVVPAFWIDTRAVTNGDYERFLDASLGANAQRSQERAALRELVARDDWLELPATSLQWAEAREYAEWAGKRLPTLAEWHLAMRGAVDAWLALPEDEGRQRLNLRTDALGRDRQTNPAAYRDFVAPALDPRGGLGPLGIHHPIGNVQTFTDTVSPTPSGASMSEQLRYLAGGYWGTPEEEMREDLLSGLAFAPESLSRPETGFRCVRSAEVT